MEIKEIDKNIAIEFIKKHHYSKTMPRINKIFIGGFVNKILMGVITFGYGVQPKHTIKKIFNSLDTLNYLEIGKLCLDDIMPRNSESNFISLCFKYIKKIYPKIKVIFTWSDALLGKVGYVYQASNFYYVGYIWTERYFTKEGILIHPRSSKELCIENAKYLNKKKVFWLTDDYMKLKGLKKIKGKQFRYIYFLCSNKEKKLLLKESKLEINKIYPKEKELAWKEKVNGKWSLCNKPLFNLNLNAREVSRVIHSNSITKGLVQFQHLAPFSQSNIGDF